MFSYIRKLAFSIGDGRKTDAIKGQIYIHGEVEEERERKGGRGERREAGGREREKGGEGKREEGRGMKGWREGWMAG